jgi:hypothetical protein
MSNTIEYWRERAQKNGAEILRLRAQLKEIRAAFYIHDWQDCVNAIKAIIHREKQE